MLTLALARDPKSRYQSAGELARELRAAADSTLSDATRRRAADLVASAKAIEATLTATAPGVSASRRLPD